MHVQWERREKSCQIKYWRVFKSNSIAYRIDPLLFLTRLYSAHNMERNNTAHPLDFHTSLFAEDELHIRGDLSARTLLSGGLHDPEGFRPIAQLLTTHPATACPFCTYTVDGQCTGIPCLRWHRADLRCILDLEGELALEGPDGGRRRLGRRIMSRL